MKFRVALLSLVCAFTSLAQQKVIPLYDGTAPGSEGWKHEEKENRTNIWQTRLVFNAARPTLTYFPAEGKAHGAAVVICPGGAFHLLSIESEGYDVARALSAKGIAAFVLKYRLVECKTDDPARELMSLAFENLPEKVKPIVPLATADGLAAIRYVREHAKEYKVKADRIGILGFSAGGTVAASVGYGYAPESRPDFVAPIYLEYGLVMKSRGVPEDAPPLFVLAATDDPLGLAPHSGAIYQAWTSAGKSAELHLYAKGGHGFGMRAQNLPSDRWHVLFTDWLEAQGFTKN